MIVTQELGVRGRDAGGLGAEQEQNKGGKLGQPK